MAIGLAAVLTMPAAALAQEEPVWEETDQTLADYLADGFQVVAVTRQEGLYATYFYLQNGSRFVYCGDFKSPDGVLILVSCFERIR